MGMEQRQGKRIKLDLPVLFRSGENAEIQEKGSLNDLSSGGCSFFSTHEIPIGERVHVQIELNEVLAERFKKKELSAKGAVIRSVRDGDRHLISVRFLK